MTSPTSVGSISVEIVGQAKDLAKNIRKDAENALKGLDLSKQVQDAVGRKPVKVEVDPVLQAFQQTVRDQVRSIARQAARIPVTADTAQLRQELSAELTRIRAQSKLKVPTEPDDRAAYETQLRAQLAAVAARVRQTVHVDVAVRGGRGGGVAGGIASALKGITSVIPGLGSVSSALGGIAGLLQNVGGAATSAGGQMAGSFGRAAGPIGALVAAVSAAVASVVAFTSGVALAVPVLGAVQAAILAVAGAAAALPAALAGIGAGVATIGLGFSGIADAFKKKPGGGGGGGGGAGEDPAARARRIAGAERGVEAARRGIAAATRGVQAAERAYDDALRRVDAAQKAYAASQAAVNRARREAKEDLEDLNRALRGAQLSQEEAALDLVAAERELNQARLTGNIPDIQKAELAYRRAQLAVEEAADTTQDLGEEAAEANRKGVEGSDKVQGALADQQQALEAVRSAQNGVLDAQDGLASANDSLKASYDGLKSAQDALVEAQKKTAAGGGGGGGALGDVVKLAPNAERFVNAVKALKPAFEALRLDVQNRLFKDLDQTVTAMWKGWEKPLRETLGSYADTFNQFFRNLGAGISTPKFITDLQAAAESGRRAIARVGEAVTSSLVPAFGTLARAAGPFIERLGEEIAKVVEEFSAWIQQADRSGSLTRFFDKTAEAMSEIFTTGKEVGKLIGNIVRILLNGNGRTDKSAISSFNDGLRAVNQWLSDPANQQRIQAFLDDLKRMFERFKETFNQVKPLLDNIFGTGNAAKSGASGLGEAIGSALVTGIVTGILTTVNQLTMAVAGLVVGKNGIVTRLNSLLGISSPSRVMAETGRNIVLGLIQGIGAMFGSLVSRVRQIPDRVRQALTGAGQWLVNTGKNAVIGLGNGVVSMLSNLRSRALNLRTTIINTGSGAGQWMVNAGRNVVFGLWNGIASLGGWLWNKVVNFVTSNVRNAFNSALGINSPSRVTMEIGRYLTEGLAIGMASKAGQVKAAADDLAGLATPNLSGLALGDMDAAISRSLQVADRTTVEAFWRSGSSGDPVLDGLRDMIGFRFRGDVQAALGS